MKISIQYFALLREQRGLADETIESAAANPDELYTQLSKQYGFTLGKKSLKVAVNDDFTNWDAPLSEGDRVVFIPPVAGG